VVITAGTLAAYDALASTVWALYAVMIGYAGGATFRHEPWKAPALGFGGAVLITLSVEGVRRFQAHRGRLLGMKERA
jgi:membrane-associated protein